MKAVVDQQTCIGCKLCVDMCPAVFSLNAEGMAQAIESDIDAAEEAAARRAAADCPVEAITIS
jgi:ferredoxin